MQKRCIWILGVYQAVAHKKQWFRCCVFMFLLAYPVELTRCKTLQKQRSSMRRRRSWSCQNHNQAVHTEFLVLLFHCFIWKTYRSLPRLPFSSNLFWTEHREYTFIFPLQALPPLDIYQNSQTVFTAPFIFLRDLQSLWSVASCMCGVKALDVFFFLKH